MNTLQTLCREWAAVAGPVYGIAAALDAEAAIHEKLTRDARLYVTSFLERWEAVERRNQTEWGIRSSVGAYLEVAGNSHLGDCTPREDIHSAFLILKGCVRQGATIDTAIGELDRVTLSMVDM